MDKSFIEPQLPHSSSEKRRRFKGRVLEIDLIDENPPGEEYSMESIEKTQKRPLDSDVVENGSDLLQKEGPIIPNLKKKAQPSTTTNK